VNQLEIKNMARKTQNSFCKEANEGSKKVKKFDDYIMLGDFNSNYDEFKTINIIIN